MLTAIYYTNPLIITFDSLYLSLVLYLKRVTNKDEALIYNCL